MASFYESALKNFILLLTLIFTFKTQAQSTINANSTWNLNTATCDGRTISIPREFSGLQYLISSSSEQMILNYESQSVSCDQLILIFNLIL